MSSAANQVLVFDADGVLIKPWGFSKALAAQHKITPDMTKPFFTGVFQRCLGVYYLLDPICQSPEGADQACMSGPDVPADPACDD